MGYMYNTMRQAFGIGRRNCEEYTWIMTHLLSITVPSASSIVCSHHALHVQTTAAATYATNKSPTQLTTATTTSIATTFPGCIPGAPAAKINNVLQ
jgi:hypothetical protein